MINKLTNYICMIISIFDTLTQTDTGYAISMESLNLHWGLYNIKDESFLNNN